MLKFNPRRIFALRGIQNDLTFLIKNGFGRGTANNILNFNNRSVKTEHIEKLCIMLRCTPNDLYEWKPDSKNVVPDDHPINTLRRSDANATLTEIVKDLPLDKLDRESALLNELKNE
jgi:hypothetical protein